MDNLIDAEGSGRSDDGASSGGFTVIESIVMLVVLCIFTLIVIGLVIHESDAVNEETLQGLGLNPPVGSGP